MSQLAAIHELLVRDFKAHGHAFGRKNGDGSPKRASLEELELRMPPATFRELLRELMDSEVKPEGWTEDAASVPGLPILRAIEGAEGLELALKE